MSTNTEIGKKIAKSVYFNNGKTEDIIYLKYLEQITNFSSYVKWLIQKDLQSGVGSDNPFKKNNKMIEDMIANNIELRELIEGLDTYKKSTPVEARNVPPVNEQSQQEMEPEETQEEPVVDPPVVEPAPTINKDDEKEKEKDVPLDTSEEETDTQPDTETDEDAKIPNETSNSGIDSSKAKAQKVARGISRRR